MGVRVLHVGWGYPPNIEGGLDVHVAEVFERLRERPDVSPTLLIPEEFAPADEPGVQGIPTSGDSITERVSSMAGPVVDAAAEHDVVHTHDWFGFELGLRSQLDAGVPWLCTLHSLSIDRNRRPSRLHKNVERRLVRCCDEVIAVSDLLADRVAAEHGIRPDVVHNGFSSVEPSGIDVRGRHGVDPADPLVFFVGRHTEQKGIPHLLLAVEKLLRKVDLTLVLGGAGPRTDQLRTFAALLGIEDHVRFAGYVPDEELGDYYAAADAFVSPALSEPFGLTITEALSVGTPVVATECGAAELVPEDCLEIVDRDGDAIAEGIATAIDREVPDYDPRTWDACARELAEYYRDLTQDS